jgi:hypothetical protein
MNSEIKDRQTLLKECFKLKLPVEKDDDYELLQLIFEAAMERSNEEFNSNQSLRDRN